MLLFENLELADNFHATNFFSDGMDSKEKIVAPQSEVKPPKNIHLGDIPHHNQNTVSIAIEPQFRGPLSITIKTQIQTNRRTNIYLDALWPDEILNKKLPIFYYPPVIGALYEQLASIEDPSQLWLSEMVHYYYGTSNYLEVQFWLKNQDGKLQLINKCNTHNSLIKMPGQEYDEKAISHEEIKWTRNTIVFGVNFNCTRTCFKSEIFIFVRVRCGNTYLESNLVELPFRRSEKRKNDQIVSTDLINPSKKQQLKRSAIKKEIKLESPMKEKDEMPMSPSPFTSNSPNNLSPSSGSSAIVFPSTTASDSVSNSNSTSLSTPSNPTRLRIPPRVLNQQMLPVTFPMNIGMDMRPFMQPTSSGSSVPIPITVQVPHAQVSSQADAMNNNMVTFHPVLTAIGGHPLRVVPSSAPIPPTLQSPSFIHPSASSNFSPSFHSSASISTSTSNPASSLSISSSDMPLLTSLDVCDENGAQLSNSTFMNDTLNYDDWESEDLSEEYL